MWRLLPHASSAPAWPASARLSPAPAIEDVLLRPVRPQTLPALFGLLPRMQKKKNVAGFSASGRWRGDRVFFTFSAKMVDFLRQT